MFSVQAESFASRIGILKASLVFLQPEVTTAPSDLTSNADAGQIYNDRCTATASLGKAARCWNIRGRDRLTYDKIQSLLSGL